MFEVRKNVFVIATTKARNIDANFSIARWLSSFQWSFVSKASLSIFVFFCFFFSFAPTVLNDSFFVYVGRKKSTKTDFSARFEFRRSENVTTNKAWAAQMRAWRLIYYATFGDSLLCCLSLKCRLSIVASRNKKACTVSVECWHDDFVYNSHQKAKLPRDCCCYADNIN